MGNFRSNDRGFSRNRSRGSFGDRKSFGGRDRGFSREKPRPEMHDALCDKCGKNCQVPFKPTEGKPVLCSDCFRAQGNTHSNFENRNSSSGISQEQFNKLEAKIDKILEILENIEFEDSEEDEENSEE